MSMKAYLEMKVDALGWSSRNSESDQNLPLGLRIGSRVQIDETPFLLAGENVSLEYPGAESLVGAYSKTNLYGLTTYRFYLEDRDSDAESMLMLVLNEQGAVAEQYLFREHAEIPLYYVSLDDVPPGADDVHAVDFWVGEAGGIIGQPIFFTPDEKDYSRLWEPELNVPIPPLKLDEMIHLKPSGHSKRQVEHVGTMLYSRSVEGLTTAIDEYILPTVEKDEAGFRTRIWVGLPLALTNLVFPDSI